MSEREKQTYYGIQSYRSDSALKQRPCSRKSSFGCTSARLPWGLTQQITPDAIMNLTSPDSLRFWERQEKEKVEGLTNGTYKPKLFENVELHQKYDQEYFRFAKLPFTSQFWLFLLHFGKWAFLIIFPLMIFTHIFAISKSSISWQQVTIELLVGLYPMVIGIPLLFWLIGHIVINHCPRIWFRPPKGPLWELNRRTGLVTIFDYKRHRKEGVIDEFIAPFYEFDAYMITTRDRYGSCHGLLLRHRYEDRQINFHSLLGPDDFKHRPCALWDFLQNYMDVSRPIPDIPLFEAYRHLDPVTEKYDKENGRNPRYWIDMDDNTFKQRVDSMWQRAYAIDTFTRPNLMERYVSYND